jgi:RNA 2',3'-cyclic 3'-phosphodiesterase
MARLFIAVWPPEEVIAELSALHRKDQRGVRFVPPENWHITLRFLGDARPDEVVDVLRGAELPSARARLGPAVDVIAERALVVPVDGLDTLARDVTKRTSKVGDPPRKRFIGHLTLARLKSTVPMPRVLGELVSASFDVEEIALVESRLDPQGARYETIEVWPVGHPTIREPGLR